MTIRKYINLDNLSTFLSGLRTTFAALVHTHTMSDITDFAVDDTLSPTSTNPVQNKVISEALEQAQNNALPIVTSSDNSKFLRVVDGVWAAVAVSNAEEASF